MSEKTPKEFVTKELKAELEETYFLIRRTRIYAFLGGAITFVCLIGILSWKISIETIKSGIGRQSIAAIEQYERDAMKSVSNIQKEEKHAADAAKFASGVIDGRIARKEKLDALKAELAVIQNDISELSKSPFAKSDKIKGEIKKRQSQASRIAGEIAELEQR